ncbi:hypothetical protein [Lutibaculum baratangense]|uniref:Uncharacterized protein n=1 Tax=Lutibaculum baratangense AMV1 TaxID=631454 RepID=V4TP21_9HYPH|nr:hypothetical protein [Lutibaculum baratangense]ESR27428.1 hypothetical protein N177_0122 [Lutibaculum baratangense AMV1]
MTTSKLPPVTQDLIRIVAIRVAGLEKGQWKDLSAEERNRHLATARRILSAERKYFTRRQNAAA